MPQMILHFLIGGVMVSAFAVLGDITYPKGFAGPFAAGPFVAIATLSLTVAAKGAGFAALEARSMIVGEGSPGVTLLLALASWLAVSSLLWYVRKHHSWARPPRSDPRRP